MELHTTQLCATYGESRCHQELDLGKARSEPLILVGFRGDAAQQKPKREFPGGCRSAAPAPSSASSEANIAKALLPSSASAGKFRPALNPDNERAFGAAVARLVPSCSHGASLKGNPRVPWLVSYFPCWNACNCNNHHPLPGKRLPALSDYKVIGSKGWKYSIWIEVIKGEGKTEEIIWYFECLQDVGATLALTALECEAICSSCLNVSVELTAYVWRDVLLNQLQSVQEAKLLGFSLLWGKWGRIQGNLNVCQCRGASLILAIGVSLSASCSVWLSEAQTEFKRVAEENVTLPCHHRLGLLEQGSLDIEWLLHISETVQKAVGSATISSCWENSPNPMLTSAAAIDVKIPLWWSVRVLLMK